MRLSTMLLVVAIAAGLPLAVGCATTTPQELTDARAEWQKVSAGEAPSYAPNELFAAREALEKAEAAFKDEGDAEQTRTAAYVALRKIQIAQAAAEARHWNDRLARERELRGAAISLGKMLRSESTEQEAAPPRIQAEAVATSLGDIAKVSEDSRGVVIGIPNSELFRPRSTDLVAGAIPKLDQIAALLKTASGHTIEVVGHTDSVGTAASNQRLTEEQAEVVRYHLIRKGVPESHVLYVGMGESRPVEPSNTPDAREDNRRTEIIIKQ